MPPVLLPPELDPLRDQHGRDIARHLKLRDGDSAALPPGLTYVFIVFTNRSGSTFLGELLASTGFFNPAGEPLNGDEVLRRSAEHGWQGFGQYFAGIAAEQARNGHFVLKASIGQLSVLTQNGILPRIIGQSRFIVAERGDKLAQAISWRIASVTGRYRSFDSPAARAPTYDGAALRRHVEDAVEAHATISRFMALNGIAPLTVSYELLTSRPAAVGQILCAELGQPALTCDLSQVRLERQATDLNREWRERFLAEEAETGAAQRSRAARLPGTLHYRRVPLASLAADPEMQVDGRQVATPLTYLPARTVAVPPVAFGDAAPPSPDPVWHAQVTKGFGVAHPAVPAWLLRNVVVHGALGIVTAGDRVVAETSDGVALAPILGAERTGDGGLRLPDRPQAVNLPSAFHLLGGAPDSYPGWLLDLLARFSGAAFDALRTAPGASSAPSVLVPPLDMFWKWESLGPMVPESISRVSLGPEGTAFVQRLLYVPRLGDAAWATHPATLPVFDALRGRFAGPDAPAPGGARRLFVRAAPGSSSLFANEADLAARAQQAGFEPIAVAEMPFVDRVRAFANASHVVAASGPALANLVFCAPGATVCELRAEGQAGWTWRHLAALRGLRYGCLVGVAGLFGGGMAPAAGFALDPARFAALLHDRRFHGG